MTPEEELQKNATEAFRVEAAKKSLQQVLDIKEWYPKLFSGQYFYLENTLRLKFAEAYLLGGISGMAMSHVSGIDGSAEDRDLAIKIISEAFGKIMDSLEIDPEIREKMNAETTDYPEKSNK